MDLHSFSCNMKEKRSRFIVSTISTAHYCHFMNIITKKRFYFHQIGLHIICMLHNVCLVYMELTQNF